MSSNLSLRQLKTKKKKLNLLSSLLAKTLKAYKIKSLADLPFGDERERGDRERERETKTQLNLIWPIVMSPSSSLSLIGAIRNSQ